MECRSPPSLLSSPRGGSTPKKKNHAAWTTTAVSASCQRYPGHPVPPATTDEDEIGGSRIARRPKGQHSAGEMEGWLNQMGMIRIAVLSSFAAHLVLILLAGIRRRTASGGRMLLLWLAYQLANWAAAYALGNLSFGSRLEEQPQLVAFWAPFLLQHLGGPDNISAYSLEDNVLSGRQALNAFVQVGGAIYVVYKHIYLGGGDRALLRASIIILAVGVAKYVERVFALRRGNLGNIRSSNKKKKLSRFTDVSGSRKGTVLDNEQALMVAHNMFPFCQRAMTDSSVNMDSPELDASREMFSFGWESMCKVVEMELSLMYDILYTKAAMVHTWGGYLIRFLSPIATVTAFVLFLFYSKDGQRREDLVITYTLLAATFILDVRWLFGAVGSTWMHMFLQARPRCWLHHNVLCSGSGIWRRLRRVIVSLHRGRLAFLMAPSSYRMWSGTIGQYSLLHECTRTCDTTTLCGRAAKKIGLEEGWNEHRHSESEGLKLSEDVKRLVFERVRKILKSTYEVDKDEEAAYSMNDVTTFWGQAAAKRRRRKLQRFRLAFGREFQEDILVWHIATQVFLTSDDGKLYAETKHAKAIKALSEYLMFLVAVRRHMLPGLVLRSLYEVTKESLQDVWRDEVGTSSIQGSGSTASGREEKLARILRDKKDADSEWGLEHDKTRLVSDGANIAMVLLSADESEMPELLELIFNVWVDKLLYAGTRCSRESHARQLSRGGELTTIVWILAEHAGPFQIGQRGPDNKKQEPCPPPPPPLPPLPMYTPERPPWWSIVIPPPPPPPPMVEQPKKEEPHPPPAPMESKQKPYPPRPHRERRRYATLYPVD
ncbi:hypothetical protein VPH35_031478 [Triticum aestivum]|uniref:uncharacterized protein isoform X1 n=2 Tax=Triticum aestivum TaxID=4565 RepID=UPI001D009D25|nr:uncharacterized protein LOC123046783 isoform X1 [Triticum aestivum]